MAKDGINIRFRGGAKLDRALADIAVTQQSKASKIVNQSLKTGSTQVKKKIIREVPKADKDTTGFRLKSRNSTVGQLRKSVKSGLRNKVNVGRDTFLAGVWFQEWKYGATAQVDDGYFAKFLINKHKPNAFGYSGGHNFVKKGVKMAESNFKNKLGGNMARKIAAISQARINKLG